MRWVQSCLLRDPSKIKRYCRQPKIYRLSPHLPRVQSSLDLQDAVGEDSGKGAGDSVASLFVSDGQRPAAYVKDGDAEGQVVSDVARGEVVGGARVESGFKPADQRVSTVPDARSDQKPIGDQLALALDKRMGEREQPPSGHEERDPELDPDGLSDRGRDGLAEDDWGELGRAGPPYKG